MLLLAKDATVTYCHSRTTDLPAIVREADVVVAAVGRPRLIRGEDIKPGAVVIDADSGERRLIWAEMDANASSDAQRNLYIRPGRNWEEGHRYIVALRNLRDRDGNPIEPQPAFAAYRDKDPGTRKPVDPRRAHMDELFKTLNQAGIKRKDLYLAWDFTVGSEQRISERMLGIRDDAFARLGDTDLDDGVVAGSAPTYRVTQVLDTPNDPQIMREVRGTFSVPCYLSLPGCVPGSKFLYTDLDSNTPAAIRTPVHYATDRECLERIMPTVGKLDLSEVTLGWIRNTMELGRVALSENLRATLEADPMLEIESTRPLSTWRLENSPFRPSLAVGS